MSKTYCVYLYPFKGGRDTCYYLGKSSIDRLATRFHEHELGGRPYEGDNILGFPVVVFTSESERNVLALEHALKHGSKRLGIPRLPAAMKRDIYNQNPDGIVYAEAIRVVMGIEKEDKNNEND